MTRCLSVFLHRPLDMCDDGDRHLRGELSSGGAFTLTRKRWTRSAGVLDLAEIRELNGY